MKCPYRMDEVKKCLHDGQVWTYEEFADCYKDDCPYWGKLKCSSYNNEYGCRKAEKEC